MAEDTWALFDLRALDAVCSSQVRYPVPANFTLRRLSDNRTWGPAQAGPTPPAAAQLPAEMPFETDTPLPPSISGQTSRPL